MSAGSALSIEIQVTLITGDSGRDSLEVKGIKRVRSPQKIGVCTIICYGQRQSRTRNKLDS